MTTNHYPGEELVHAGLRDLQAEVVTPNALLVAIGAPRLRRLGVVIPEAVERLVRPEHQLYDLLTAHNGARGYTEYNSLIRRLVSYEHALERAVASRAVTVTDDGVSPPR